MQQIKTTNLYKVTTKYIKMGFTLCCLFEIHEKKEAHQLSTKEIEDFFKQVPFYFDMSDVETLNDKIKLKEVFRDEEVRLNMPCYITVDTFKIALKLLRVQSRIDPISFVENKRKLITSINKNNTATKEKLLNIIKLYIPLN